MKYLLTIVACIPGLLFAQLDRIRTNMTETEFVKVIPEAERDLDAEAFWLNEEDTVNGIPGTALWRIYNDSVSTFRFKSQRFLGPSKTYPGFDSAGAHLMRVTAEKYRATFEREFGKPEVYQSTPFTNVGASLQGIQPYAVWAVWQFGEDEYISVKVSTDLSSGNFINAPGKFTVVEADAYEFSIEVKHRSGYTGSNYCIGLNLTEFITIHPACAQLIKPVRDHIYRIDDSVTSEDAGWKFVFTSGQLISFRYSLYEGTGYGARSDKSAYTLCNTVANKLFGQGNIAFGAPNASERSDYKDNDQASRMAYRNTYLLSSWLTPSGEVKLEFSETGGGKSPDAIFLVEVLFGEQ